MKFELIVQEIKKERARHQTAFGEHEQLTHLEFLQILVEEVGEVASAQTPEDRKEELIQVASVCFAWLENNFEEEKRTISELSMEEKTTKLIELLETWDSSKGDFECGLISNEDWSKLEKIIDPLFEELIVKKEKEK